MNIFISTNHLNKASKWEELPSILIDGVGIEVFPLWSESFEDMLQKYKDQLLKRPITFHSPYYGVEPSLSEDEEGYEEMIASQIKTLKWAKKLKAKSIVFHHNNKRIEDKDVMLKNAHQNYLKIQKLSEPFGVVQVVENAGVLSSGNMLLDQDEFIDYCKKNSVTCLIDVGHVHANGWNIKKVVESLKNQICFYHLHNNDGVSDSHQRIRDGSFDMEEFAYIYKTYTPKADLTLEYSPKLKISTEDLKNDIDWIRMMLY